MADGGQEESLRTESRGQMLQRHKRELTDVKSKIARLSKKQQSEGEKMMKDTLKRHEDELAALASGGAAPAPAADAGAEAAGPSQLAEKLQAAAITAADSDSDDDKPTAPPAAGAAAAPPAPEKKQGPTKAQKRKAQKAKQEADRERQIAEEKANMGESVRSIEETAILRKLEPLGLKIYEVKADGHCLYRSLEDQLALQNDGMLPGKDYLGLRKLASAYVREHEEEYRPFLDECADDSAEAAASFDKYCRDIADTATWAGQLEIGALANALKQPVCIYSAHLPEVKMGENFPGEPLRVAYFQHAYGLGEHYNSVRVAGAS